MYTWLSKMLVLTGIFITLLGLAVWLVPKIPWLGKLPGDIRYQGERVTFYFPVVTCLVLSVLLTILLNLLMRR